MNNYAFLHSNTLAPTHQISSINLDKDRQWNVVEATNYALHYVMNKYPNAIMFGEDIADPKGGVFGVSKGLSTNFPERVYNSPLAEATIAGVASGLALQGWLPIIELQFIDFVGPAINQIMNQIATMRWRTAGKQSLPLIILAPCGGYISGAGAWHSQTNESIFAHMPGLRVVMPSTPQDAVNALLHAAKGTDPVLILLPKKQFFRMQAISSFEELYDGQPKIRHKGSDVTVVTWGNGTELCNSAQIILVEQGISCEIIDLRTLSPVPLDLLCLSLQKTGRLVIVQEDCRQCSLGQSLIAELLSNISVWDSLYSPPVLISRENVHVPFHHTSAIMTLPNVNDICDAIRRVISQ